MPAERTDPKIVLKATPPRLMKHFLARLRLSSESAKFNDRSIMAVSAPGGFGKTSLLGNGGGNAVSAAPSSPG